MKLLSFLPKLLILGLLFIAMPSPAPAQVSIGLSINIGPPALPVYEQPPVPAPGYIWTPGYWAWDGNGGQYYWVPGTWVIAPQIGYLWTPGYWGWNNGFYAWNAGYWGPHIGYYGGINYGHGYFGNGYVGGGWYGRQFRYNTAVTNVNTTIVRNVYVNKSVVVNNYNTVNRVSYNGGPGGTVVRPTPAQRLVMSEHRLPPTALQVQHQHYASLERSNFVAVNHGHPVMAAVARPLTSTARPVGYAPAHTATAFDRFNASRGNAVTTHAPATTYHAPTTTYHAPTTTYHAPATTYRAPSTTYHPATTYHAPTTYHATAKYSAPKTVSHGAPQHPQAHTPPEHHEK